MKNYWKILLPLLFALAIALGLIQRQHNPYLLSRQASLGQTSDAKKTLADYYQLAQNLKKDDRPQTAQATFLAVGDIMLSRNVAAAIQKNASTRAGSLALDLPFEKMGDVLRSTNFNFGNLESPIVPPPTGNGIVGGHSMIFAAPGVYAGGLEHYNFKILNLANNHALDRGLSGIHTTSGFLDTAEIQHVGTGDNLDQAWKPAVLTANGIKICFVGASYASINDNGKTTNNNVARIEDLDDLKSSILSAKGGSASGGKSSIFNLKSSCDFIVATMHAGTEYTRKPNSAQIAFAHAAIDYGADMVIGAHPHWVQTIERYCPNSASILDAPSPIHGEGAGGEVKCSNPKYIFYSLGNFIFDQMWSRETRAGLTLKITLSKNVGAGSARPGSTGDQWPPLQGPDQPTKLESIELLPVIIDNYSTPRPAMAKEAKKILEKIGETENILK